MKAYRLCNGPSISHVFYANDCLFIAHTTSDNTISLATIINVYAHHSSQTSNYTNLQKKICPATSHHIKSAILTVFGI